MRRSRRERSRNLPNNNRNAGAEKRGEFFNQAFVRQAASNGVAEGPQGLFPAYKNGFKDVRNGLLPTFGAYTLRLERARNQND